jgi:hypothetical protein
LEYLIEDDPDIDLTGLESFSFARESDIEYALGISNLGTTGRLYLNCYTGKCHYEKTYRCTKTRCHGTGEERECEDYESTCTDTYFKKSIHAQVNAEDQDQAHVVVIIVIIVNLLIIMIIVPAHMMMILKT